MTPIESQEVKALEREAGVDLVGELLDEYRAIRFILLKHGRWDEEEMLETEERIREFIVHLENYLSQRDWHTKGKGEKLRTYVSKRKPDKYIELRYSITYPDARTFYRIELKLKRKRLLCDKVVAEGEMMFSRI
ncbi:MAG: hypothetical protein JSW70_04980 [Syntrophobacterales bacterium]|nr:MAG: hypothetical protein JSW70_04980 [Syntrophobacterales bacterium]